MVHDVSRHRLLLPHSGTRWVISASGERRLSSTDHSSAYASLFLSTLPHTSLDAGTWVWSWIISRQKSSLHLVGVSLWVVAVQLLAQLSFFILGAKVRSRALLFLYKLFFQLVYHVFYRNLVSFV
jgi:hypothetical protein